MWYYHNMNLKCFLEDVLNNKSIMIFKFFRLHKQCEFSGREIAGHLNLNHIVCLKVL